MSTKSNINIQLAIQAQVKTLVYKINLKTQTMKTKLHQKSVQIIFFGMRAQRNKQFCSIYNKITPTKLLTLLIAFNTQMMISVSQMKSENSTEREQTLNLMNLEMLFQCKFLRVLSCTYIHKLDAGGFPYRSARTKQPCYAPGCLYPSRWLPWLRRCIQNQ
ncbi:Hypothetical_protein [Hexamita inflata]|uniref:Hypothetical_protein n=1 Tax=Hexamita inflata TaxID=28002 RepID=A0AA86RKN2_9EUKA|nr:Hypothetical protein HINF_LOCUS63008 [Hexamita inflata]